MKSFLQWLFPTSPEVVAKHMLAEAKRDAAVAEVTLLKAAEALVAAQADSSYTSGRVNRLQALVDSGEPKTLVDSGEPKTLAGSKVSTDSQE